MTTLHLLSVLRERGVHIWVEGDRLRYRAPPDGLDLELLEQLRTRKHSIIKLLENNKRSIPNLQHIPDRSELRLSLAQERLWFLDQLEPDSPVYNIPIGLRFAGALNVPVLQRCLNEVLRRHEPLRTSFKAVEGHAVQVIQAEASLEMPLMDLRDLSKPEREAKAKRLCAEEAQRPFDLTRDLLLRARLFRLGEVDHILFLNMHHIASDGWSVGVLVRELSTLYEAFVEGKPSPLPELPIQYVDFAAWQREWLQGEVLEKQLGYWRKQLERAPPLLELPADHPRPAVQSYRGALLSWEVPKPLAVALGELSRREGATLFMTLLASFQTLLHRYTGSDDIIVGSPIAGRNRMELEPLIGFFINSLVLRGDLSGNPSFRTFLGRTREAALGAYAHQDIPFERLVEELNPERNLSRSPFFQVMFVLENAPWQAAEFAGLEITPMPIDIRTSKFDLTLCVRERGELLHAVVTYNTDLFEAETIRRMLRHYQTLLEGIVSNPDRPLSDLPLLTSAECQQLLVEWNRTEVSYPKDRCLDEFIEEQAERTPAAVAVVFDGKHLTYHQLNERANQLAHYLQKLGVGSDTLVGICVERSLEMVVGLLGILKAGGAYVPLDPNYPQDRLAFILDDAQPRVLLTQLSLRDRLRTQDATVLCLDALTIPPAGGEHVPSTSERQASDLAYVIYTSGSTGQPKGVQITHRALVNFLKAMEHDPGITEEDKLLSVTSLSFDIAGLELYLPLLVGAQVTIAPSEVAADGSRLGSLISQCGATIMQATPATWRLLLDAGWDGRQHLKILCGGEAWSAELARALLPRCASLWNMYGPTETTVWSSIAKIETGQPVLVRPPIANTTFYVFDPYCQLVPIGVPGELHIGGIGLARGYHNRPELTAEKFIPDPFRSEPEARLYKTGDLVRYLPDGAIEYLGRLDHQVKIRGFRIELGEIESVLAALPGVREAVVVAREDLPGDKRLVAYLIVKEGEPPKDSELRDLLRTKLPDYMVPSAFVTLDRFPLTPNGKLDRRALPRPDFQSNPVGFVPPASAMEEALANIWTEVLGIEQVGRHDNFFELGGHSLLAVRLISRIRAVLGFEIALRSLFEVSTVKHMAEIVSGEKSISSFSPLVLLRPGAGGSPPVFIVHGVGGSVMELIPMAKSFPGDKPIYGIQAKGFDGSIPNHTVEAMAEDYISAITEVQPHGPYILAGVSFGGLVALEIAQRLIERGDQVGFLGFLETYPSRRFWPLPSRVKNKVQNKITRRIKKHFSVLRPLGGKERARHFMSQLRLLIRRFAGKYVDDEDSLPPAVKAVLDAGRAAGKSYRPRFYPGEISYLKCEINTLVPDDPVPIWRHLAKTLEVQSVPGDHLDLVSTCSTDVANWIFSRVQNIAIPHVRDVTVQVGDGGGRVLELVGIDDGVFSEGVQP